MKKPESFMVSEDNEFEDDDEEVVSRSGGGTGVTDPALFNALLDLRKKMSKNLNVPPYVIFQDPSLEAMATMYPVSIRGTTEHTGSRCREGKTLRKGVLRFDTPALRRV